MRTAHSHFSEEGKETKTNTGQGVRQPALSLAKGHLPAICLSCLLNCEIFGTWLDYYEWVSIRSSEH